MHAHPESRQPDEYRRIEGEVETGIGRIQLVRSLWNSPIDRASQADGHHVQLSLLPMAGRALGCFPDHWGPHRFEPIGEMFFVPADQLLRTRSNCRH